MPGTHEQGRGLGGGPSEPNQFLAVGGRRDQVACAFEEWVTSPGAKLPEEWCEGGATFIPKSRCRELAAQARGAAGPVAWPCDAGDAYRALLPAPAPPLVGGGLCGWGNAQSLIVMATLLAEETNEWGEPLWLLKVDLADSGHSPTKGRP